MICCKMNILQSLVKLNKQFWKHERASFNFILQIIIQLIKWLFEWKDLEINWIKKRTEKKDSKLNIFGLMTSCWAYRHW